MLTNTSAYAECADTEALMAALLNHRRPAAIATVQNRPVAEFLELCLVPAETRSNIDAVLQQLPGEEAGVI